MFLGFLKEEDIPDFLDTAEQLAQAVRDKHKEIVAAMAGQLECKF